MMVTRNAIESINYLRKLWDGPLPVYSRHETQNRRLPCIVYSKTAACIIDVGGNCKYECAYASDAQTVIYVDGGWKKEGFGILGIWYGEHDPRNLRMVTLECIDSFECEVLAIIRVLEREWFNESESIEIRTDNRTACGIFHHDNVPAVQETPIVKRLLDLIERFPKRHRLNVAWVKGHSNWDGNNKADELTKLHLPPKIELPPMKQPTPPPVIEMPQMETFAPQPYIPQMQYHPFPFQVYNNIQLPMCMLPQVPMQHPPFTTYDMMQTDYASAPPCYAF